MVWVPEEPLNNFLFDWGWSRLRAVLACEDAVHVLQKSVCLVLGA